MSIRRGDVVLMDYPFTSRGAKVRPALVIQNDHDNGSLWNIIVVMITSNTRRAAEPMQLLIGVNMPEGMQAGLRQTSAVNCSNLTRSSSGRSSARSAACPRRRWRRWTSA